LKEAAVERGRGQKKLWSNEATVKGGVGGERGRIREHRLDFDFICTLSGLATGSEPCNPILV